MVFSRITRATFVLALVLLSSHGTAAVALHDGDVVAETSNGQDAKLRRIRRLVSSEDNIEEQMASLYGFRKPPPHAESQWPYMGKQLRQSDKAVLAAKTEGETLNNSFETFERSAVVWRGIGGVMSMDPGSDDMPPPSGNEPSENPPETAPPVEIMPSENPPSEIMPSETAPPVEIMPSEIMPSEIMPSDSLPPVEDGQPSGGQPSDGQPSGGQPSDGPSPVSGREPSADPLPTPGPIDPTLAPTVSPTRTDNDPNGNNDVVTGPPTVEPTNGNVILWASLGGVAGVSVLACCALMICQWRKRNAGPPAPLPA